MKWSRAEYYDVNKASTSVSCLQCLKCSNILAPSQRQKSKLARSMENVPQCYQRIMGDLITSKNLAYNMICHYTFYKFLHSEKQSKMLLELELFSSTWTKFGMWFNKPKATEFLQCRWWFGSLINLFDNGRTTGPRHAFSWRTFERFCSIYLLHGHYSTDSIIRVLSHC